MADRFSFGRFFMNLQSLERTYIDKVFALCDYYDYQAITDYFAEETVPYDDVIGQMRTLAASNLFAK